MIQFYGAPMSSSGRSRWMLEEVGVPYEYNVVNLHDDDARRRFFEVFKGGKVPYLIDGDVRLFESMAINFYLAEKYKPSLLPSKVEQRALMYQWSFWSITNLQPEALKYMAHSMLLVEGERDPKTMTAAKASCRRYLDQLESGLQGQYLVGDSFSIADLNCASVVNLALRAGVEAGAKVTDWMSRMRERPAWKVVTQEVSLK